MTVNADMSHDDAVVKNAARMRHAAGRRVAGPGVADRPTRDGVARVRVPALSTPVTPLSAVIFLQSRRGNSLPDLFSKRDSFSRASAIIL
eukprot:scaffold69302_cov68-Phaeocystis_antarctica.AAC.4